MALCSTPSTTLGKLPTTHCLKTISPPTASHRIPFSWATACANSWSACSPKTAALHKWWKRSWQILKPTTTTTSPTTPNPIPASWNYSKTCATVE